MKKISTALMVLFTPIAAAATGIDASDVAAYAIDGKDDKPSATQIRLSRDAGRWVVEGKEGAAPWKNISCDRGCEYRTSTSGETSSYLAALPTAMAPRFDMGCIQNNANAFCKLARKGDPAIGGYLFIALVSGKPVSMSLTRLIR